MSEDSVKIVENVTNVATGDQKKIISRIVLQRLMSNDSSKFLAEKSFKDLNALFLSENPDREISLEYRMPNARANDYYNSNISSVGIKWEPSREELQDLEGNVWNTHQLRMNIAIGSMYSGGFDAFTARTDCISALRDVLAEILEMVPGPIRVMTLNNEQRIERDNKRKYDAACTFFVNMFDSTPNRQYRVGLRKGGRGRAVSRELVAAHGHGTYVFEIDDGSRRRPNRKKYILTIPENVGYYAYIKRIA